MTLRSCVPVAPARHDMPLSVLKMHVRHRPQRFALKASHEGVQCLWLGHVDLRITKAEHRRTEMLRNSTTHGPGAM
jgi:hypothetical protein